MNEDFLGEIEEFYEKPIVGKKLPNFELEVFHKDRKSTRLNSSH